MKIGIIFCAYNSIDYLDQSLAPWVAARAARLGNHDYIIGAVSMPFEGFPNDAEDGTIKRLEEYVSNRSIDFLLTNPTPVKETDARGMAMEELRGAGAEIIIQWDADEIITEREILNLTKYIDDNPYIPWFKIAYRNYVFDTSTYLAENFCPPRVHRLDFFGRKAFGFYQDNNVMYESLGEAIRDIDLPNLTVPSNLCNPRHESWLSNERSKKKIQYQVKRWNSCSFRWDEETNSLKFNEEYYRAHNLPIPEVVKE